MLELRQLSRRDAAYSTARQAIALAPIARPVVAGIRLRKRRAADVRGAARFLAETLAVVRRIAPAAGIVVRTAGSPPPRWSPRRSGTGQRCC
ncbi:MAG TPA: hypothetical protein VFP72_22315 [Kineosporiaceae bacterium]|nr:hypothetical protein [Kineosporiaceae bacterium]